MDSVGDKKIKGSHSIMSHRRNEIVGDTQPSIGSSVAWNLYGSALPLLVGVIAIPMILSHLGVERFGILTLGWLTLGYFSLFDFGLGRAMTMLIADAIGEDRATEVPAIFGTCMVMMVAFGIVGAFALFAFSDTVVQLLSISGGVGKEATVVFKLLAITVPVVIVLSGLRGFLEAHHAFRLINLIRLPFGVAHYLVPLVLIWFSADLIDMVICNVALKILQLAVMATKSYALLGEYPTKPRFIFTIARRVAKFGSWMTISNIVGPLMVYMDGFIISGLMGAATVAYYTVPYELVTKLWIVTGAIIAALFPMLVQFSSRGAELSRSIFSGAAWLLLEMFTPIVLLICILAETLLAYWLGAEFASFSAQTAQLLLLGVFVNSVAQFMFALVQSHGYVKLTAVLHLIELPLYIAVLWSFLNAYGLIGAAMAWLLRVSFDALLLAVASIKLVPGYKSEVLKLSGYTCGVLMLGLSIVVWPLNSLVITSSLAVTVIMLWRLLVRFVRAASIWKSGDVADFWRALFENR